MTKRKTVACDQCGTEVNAYPTPKGWITLTAVGSVPATRDADLCGEACLVAYLSARDGGVYERIGRLAP